VVSAEAIEMETRLWRETDTVVERRLRLTRIAAALLRTPGFLAALQAESQVSDEDVARTKALRHDLYA
jgi:hypothetical protein